MGKDCAGARGGRHTHAVSRPRPQPHDAADVIRRLKALSSQAAAFASPGGCWTALYPATGYAKGRAPKLNSHLSPACAAFPSAFADSGISTSQTKDWGATVPSNSQSFNLLVCGLPV